MMTNYEKIKSMSKEELSKFIVNCLLGDCYKGVEQWLESECDE